jgi:hypothetical protein
VIFLPIFWVAGWFWGNGRETLLDYSVYRVPSLYPCHFSRGFAVTTNALPSFQVQRPTADYSHRHCDFDNFLRGPAFA